MPKPLLIKNKIIMTRILQGPVKVLNAKASNGVGSALNVASYKSVNISLFTSGNAAATIKFAISNALTMPDFSSPPSPTNPYDYVQISWLNNDSSNPGSTGIVLTGTDIGKIFEVNTNYQKWICPIVSGYSAGAINCEIDAVNDETN